MERKFKISLYVIIAIVIIALLCGIGYYISKQQSEEVSMKETEQSNKEITIEDFKNALEQKGLKITNTTTKLGSLIGAIEGYGYTINNETIEIYKFDVNSNDNLTVNNIKSAKEKEIITMPDFNNMTFKAKYNKGFVIINFEQHPSKDKILEAFNEL